MQQNNVIFLIFQLPLKIIVCYITLLKRYHYSLGRERWPDKVSLEMSSKGCKGQAKLQNFGPGNSVLDKATSMIPKYKAPLKPKGALCLKFFKLWSRKPCWEGFIPQ